jgi:hypothetical protein
MSDSPIVRVELQQQRDYQFEIRFGETLPPLLGDEPAPLGQGPAPRRPSCWRRPWATA